MVPVKHVRPSNKMINVKFVFIYLLVAGNMTAQEGY